MSVKSIVCMVSEREHVSGAFLSGGGSGVFGSMCACDAMHLFRCLCFLHVTNLSITSVCLVLPQEGRSPWV